MKAGRFAFFDLGKFVIKRLARGVFGLPGHAIDQMPKRYIIPCYFFATLATVHGWMVLVAIFFPQEGGLPIGYSIIQILLFYGLALFVIWLYPQNFISLLGRFIFQLLEIARRLKAVFKLWIK